MDEIVPDVDAWLAALDRRHRANLLPREFTKAVRALSARYVERRAVLPDRAPIDSAGKRAAFAGFYAPLHFLTVTEIVRAVATRAPPATILDLGCGSGVAGAAWAREMTPGVISAAEITPGVFSEVIGIDKSAWALDEARWNWQALGVRGKTRRGDLVAEAKTAPAGVFGIIAAWSANELEKNARAALLSALLAQAERGAQVLVIEPLATSAAPWWPEWAAAAGAAGGRVDEWRFDVDLPPSLAAVDESAGFNREGLTARSIYLS